MFAILCDSNDVLKVVYAYRVNLEESTAHDGIFSA